MESVSKHYCKVCNRGFGCAGALGGHMRSHSVGDNNVSNIIRIPDGGSNNTKHPYFLRNNSNRFPSYRGIEDGENLFLENKSSPNQEDGHHHHYQYAASEEEDLANYLVMLSSRKYVFPPDEKAKEMEKVGGFNGFQCKACKKVFSSHQALGGHRASHKKVKGCYAAKYVDDDNNDENNSTHHDLSQDDEEYKLSPQSSPEEAVVADSRRKISKVHECFICHRVFSSGQALGGHKRCHWLTTNNLSDNTFIPNLQDFQYYDPEYQHIFKKPMFSNADGETKFDLNLPPTYINFNSTSRTDNMRCNVNNNGDGEEQCKTTTKIARLSELKDLKFDEGSSSRWLQMGITSTTTNIP